MITAKEVREIFRYDPATGFLFYQINGTGRPPAGSRAGYFEKSTGRIRVGIRGKYYSVSRIVWLMVHGEFPSDEIDHINGIKTDNRIKNLRPVNHQENMRNKPLQVNNTSGVMGVSWSKSHQKWVAYIYLNGKQMHLGEFTKFKQAVTVRRAAEPEYGFHENHGRIAAGA